MAALGAMPGVFSRIAETEPPNDVAPITPPIMVIASHGSMPKVSGIRSAIAVVPPSPGTAPKISPTKTPRQR